MNTSCEVTRELRRHITHCRWLNMDKLLAGICIVSPLHGGRATMKSCGLGRVVRRWSQSICTKMRFGRQSATTGTGDDDMTSM